MMIETSPTTWTTFTLIPLSTGMRSERLIGRTQQFTALSNAAWLMGIGRLPLAMANMARVDVGLDEASPTYELNWLRANRIGYHSPRQIAIPCASQR